MKKRGFGFVFFVFWSKASNSFSEVGVGSALDQETQAEKGDLLDFYLCLFFIY